MTPCGRRENCTRSIRAYVDKKKGGVVGKTCELRSTKWQRNGSFSRVSNVESQSCFPCGPTSVSFSLCVDSLCVAALESLLLLTAVDPAAAASRSLVLFTQCRSAAGIPRIPYRATAGPADLLCFKHYNAGEVCCVYGRVVLRLRSRRALSCRAKPKSRQCVARRC